MKKFLKWILAGILTAGSIAMCVSAYGKFSDSVTVTNHISTGDINISMKELEKKNTKYVQFFVSDAGKAAQIIDGAFKIKSMKIVDKNTLYLYDMSFPVAMINRTLVEAGIDVSEAHLCENTLEDYFKKITGGEGIA